MNSIISKFKSNSQKFINKISFLALRRKKLTAAVVIVIVIGGFWGYQKIRNNGAGIQYTVSAAEKGTLVTSVSGTGQVSASNQVDVKFKGSGRITYIGVQEGQNVAKGAFVAKLDTQDAEKAIRDAQANLESAKLALEKLKGPDSLAVARNKEDAQKSLDKSYEDGFNSVSTAFLDLPSIMAGLQDILYGSEYSPGMWNMDYYVNAVFNYDTTVMIYRNDADVKYKTVREEYDKNFADYKATSRLSDTSVIDSLINETYNTTRDIAEAIKSANNLIQFYKDELTEKNLTPKALADTQLSNLNSYTGKTNNFLVDLLSIQSAISDDKDALSNADIDIASQELSVRQRENALQDAKDNLADYYVYSPFEGTIAQLNAKVGDSASGSSIATLITRQKIAEISLNEVDVAKVKIGQKANLTFDAVSDLNITGEVIQLDILGQANQGVVTYGVKIGFDTQDERIKPGMSVSAVIITDVKQDVILVPNSAVKSNNSANYVDLLINNAPSSAIVQTGLSNDTMIEIVSGIKTGDKVITQTINKTSASQTASSPNSNFRFQGAVGGGGFGR